jgi:hypothetical protein
MMITEDPWKRLLMSTNASTDGLGGSTVAVLVHNFKYFHVLW